MSYDIVYEKQFIKTTDGRILPLILIGPSNCWDYSYSNGRSYEKRVREWCLLFGAFLADFPWSPEDLLNEANKHIGKEFQEHFKFRGKWIDDAAFIRFVKYGVRNAATIEELSEKSHFPIFLRGDLSVSTKSGEFYSDGTEKWTRSTELSTRIESSDELEHFLDKARARISGKTEDERIYLQMSFPGEKAIQHPKEVKKRSRRLPAPEGTCWFIMRSDGAYLDRLTRGGANLSWSPSNAKWFSSEAAAIKYSDKHRINERFSMEYRVVAVDMPRAA